MYQTIAALALAGLLGGCASTPPAALEIARRDQVIEIDGKTTQIVIDNRYGDITVRTTDDPRLGLHAVIQSIRADGRDYTVRSASRANALEVSVQRRGSSGRLDLTVFAPKPIALALRSETGAIRARGVEAPLEIRTRTGAIRFSAAGRVDVASASGAIQGSLEGRRPLASSRVISDSGAIALGVPLNGALAIDARSSTRLDDTLKLTPIARTPTHAQWRIGTATNTLQIRTAGTISLVPMLSADTRDGGSVRVPEPQSMGDLPQSMGDPVIASAAKQSALRCNEAASPRSPRRCAPRDDGLGRAPKQQPTADLVIASAAKQSAPRCNEAASLRSPRRCAPRDDELGRAPKQQPAADPVIASAAKQSALRCNEAASPRSPRRCAPRDDEFGRAPQERRPLVFSSPRAGARWTSRPAPQERRPSVLSNPRPGWPMDEQK
jgi:hypothetical protein